MADKDTRRRNWAWEVRSEHAERTSDENRRLAVLMDIREELQTLNRLLGCVNFTQFPATLRAIQRNTAKKRKPRKAKK